MNSVLIVDDEPNYLVVLAELLKDENFQVFTAGNGYEALTIVKNTDLDIVITDMRMPGMDGLALLKAIKTYNKDLPVIMATAFGEVEKAVAAMQAGAFNYLTKPFNNAALISSVKKAVEIYGVLRENSWFRKEMRLRYGFASMVGKNKKMQEIYELIEKVAQAPTTVMITGESGTGKELVAKAIHFKSPRGKAPFVSINCAGIPESLLESALFGHEKGAFTGAIALHKGKFELADKGALFLDEVAEMAMPLQAKLLRVIQERSFERVGGNKTINVDVRIITATNKDLKEEVEKGNFRQDLYYRFNVLNIHLPPLRERIDDIPMLTSHFITKFAKRLNRPKLEISPNGLRLLLALPWKGNIRELENTIERAAVLCTDNCITPEDLVPGTTSNHLKEIAYNINLDLEQMLPLNFSLPDFLDTIENNIVKKALKETGHIQTQAAKHLGITKSLLQYKIKKYSIQINK